MYKQIIVVNKRLNMSPGKLGAMTAHGSISFLCEWFKHNVSMENATTSEYTINPFAKFDRELFANWVNGSFTKIILSAKDENEMKQIIEEAQENNMICGKDFFNIVDESTEFNGVPQWAVVAFRPMDSVDIDPITGKLPLYGYEDVLK